QVAALHTLVHASSLFMLPSSQVSPGPTCPSPHTCVVQFDLHALSSPLSGPSSHCSTPTCTQPSPQAASSQARVQAPLLLLALPRSQSSSMLACGNPSPQLGGAHRSVQPSSWSPFWPSSQTSPSSTIALPQPSLWHTGLQPSPPTTL